MFGEKYACGGTMTAHERTDLSSLAGAQPVFRGLEEATVSAREIAAMLDVAPSTVSKWRQGRAKVPPAELAFLTLVLADWLDEIERQERPSFGRGGSAMALRLEAARCALRLQEARNASLSPAALSEGAETFRARWSARVERRDGARSSWDLEFVMVT